MKSRWVLFIHEVGRGKEEGIGARERWDETRRE